MLHTTRTTSAMQHLHHLAVEIGERAAGTPAHQRAEQYVREVFQAAGLQIEAVSVDFPNWSLKSAALIHAGESLPVDVNPFSPACDVSLPTVPVSTLPELEAADLSGKIALLYGELSKAPIFPINFAPVQFERDQTINRLLMEKSPAAVLAVNLHPWRRVHIFEDEDFSLPSATLNVEVGRRLLQDPGAVVELQIETDSKPTQITTLVGYQNPIKTPQIVLCAHYDTKFGTPGAYDNGTGMAAVLALAEILQNRDLGVGIQFVAWADEEYGAHSDSAYAAAIGQGFDEMLCAINLDGIAALAENNSVALLGQSEAFEKAVREVQAHYPAIVDFEPWVQSNHYTYFARGVPAVALTSLNWERAHQADDTVAWVSAARLDESIAFVLDLIDTFADKPVAWFRPE